MNAGNPSARNGRGAAAIRRYQGSALRRRSDGVCRFHPTCSEYARQAFEQRALPVALGMTASRLLRCNPLVRPFTADPVDHRRFAPRPGTLRALSALTMIVGTLLAFAVAGVAAADAPTGGCTGSANGRDAAGITRGDPLVVGKGDTVSAEGTTPPGKSGTNSTTVEVVLVDPLGGVTGDAYVGEGDTWSSSSVKVDDWLKYGVGLYKVDVTNTGPGWTCSFVGYVKLDGNPLSTPVGLAAGAMVVVGAVGGAAAVRAKPDPGRVEELRRSAPDDDLDGLDGIVRGGLDAMRSCGATALTTLLLLPLLAMPVVGMGGGAGAGLPVWRTPPGRVVWERRFRSRGHWILGGLSGLVFGLGLAVLLQQYGVWILSVVTVIVVPLVLAAGFGAIAFRGRGYRLVRVARDAGTAAPGSAAPEVSPEVTPPSSA